MLSEVSDKEDGKIPFDGLVTKRKLVKVISISSAHRIQ